MTIANPFSAFPDRSQVVELAVRRAARDLFWSGWTITAIAEHIGQKRSTVETWKQRGKWEQATSVDKISDALDQRMRVLITKENKDPKDFKEIDLLGREIERMCKIQARSARASADGGNDENAAPQSPRRRPKRNAMTDEQRQKLIDAVKEWLIGHQRIWYMNRAMRRRNILKSRQIGATFYFSMEALERALETGYNQIFLSASRAQAHVFKSYIRSFALKAAEVELTGDPIILPNGAEMIFLGTSSRTAQSYNGDLYFDEYFWVGNFMTLNKVAQGMATHKHLRMTHFSTPSTTTHEAYQFWTGAHFNKGRAADKRVEIDVSHTALARGLSCPDGQWRQIVTVEDAVTAGFDKIDIDEQRNSNSPADFANLYMCEFVDDTASVFPFDMMKRCMVDSWEAWTDVKPHEARPFGMRPVWIGYDPALSSEGDAAGCVVIAPPSQPGGKFRVLERHRWRGEDFETQAQYVREITRRFNVTKITVDATGVGYGLYRLVQQFFPRTYALQYSPELKTRLILKAQSVIGNQRLEFDASYTDLVQSFMSIRRAMTPSGSKLTYTAARSQEIGHADLAWACMHALDNEPLEGATRARSTVEFY